jgi:chemotaxis regulatin CheY-phosphate phosphatase CheZ
MAEPRKVFRIEETARLARRSTGAPASPRHSEVMQAHTALRGAKASPSPAAETGGTAYGESRWLGIEAAHLTRIAHELAAVTAGTDQATQKILAAAEEIDQLANNLSASLKGKIEQGLAQDISDHVIRIFEACNFQDLIGQRVSKVMTTLEIIEERVARAIDEIKNAPARGGGDAYLHGPRLDIDRGHIAQNEIDSMFDG